jgi:hypothetical protein
MIERRSIGMGKMMVEFFSAEIEFNVYEGKKGVLKIARA